MRIRSTTTRRPHVGWRIVATCFAGALAAHLGVTASPASAATVHCYGLEVTIPTATDGADTINGTEGPDVINGLRGNDTIWGNGGNDVICGGEGVDRIGGGFGNDKIAGNTGNDVISGNEAVPDFRHRIA